MRRVTQYVISSEWNRHGPQPMKYSIYELSDEEIEILNGKSVRGKYLLYDNHSVMSIVTQNLVREFLECMGDNLERRPFKGIFETEEEADLWYQESLKKLKLDYIEGEIRRWQNRKQLLLMEK